MTAVDNWEDEKLNPVFWGRDSEMQWLFDHFRRHHQRIVISGPPGIGKTALLRQFLTRVRTERPPLVFTARDRPDEAMAEIGAKVEALYSERNPPEIVAIGEAEMFNERQLAGRRCKALAGRDEERTRIAPSQHSGTSHADPQNESS